MKKIMCKTKKKFNLKNDATVTYDPNFINKQDAIALFNELKTTVPWGHGVYNMFGKSVKTPRKLYAMRDKNVDIKSSYNITDSMEWSPLMKKLKDKIIKETGHKITYAQLNYYINGQHYIGYHSDSEVQKGDIIASVSLGGIRKFVLRHNGYKTLKNTTGTKHEMFLENGSLLIMNDNAAKFYYKHSLPKMKHADERINITFRPK
jgi:alkylated DNA repair dioxygenase AlkB